MYMGTMKYHIKTVTQSFFSLGHLEFAGARNLHYSAKNVALQLSFLSTKLDCNVT